MQTTQELIQNLQNQITNYKPENEGDTTKEKLQEYYDMAKEISTTINLAEIQIIWCLRHTLPYDTKDFLNATKNLYEKNRGTLPAREPKNGKDE